MRTIAFFNNKGGVGKTTLVYHFAYMLAELGHTVLAADLDPQANLTSMFLSEEKQIDIYSNDTDRATIMHSLKPLDRGLGDIRTPHIIEVTTGIGLIAGDLELSVFEDKLSENWEKCNDGDEAAFRISSSFYRILQQAGHNFKSDYCIIDVGPDFGAINRAVMICADYIIVPMAADLFSLQGLKNLGGRLEKWRREWNKRTQENPDPQLILPPASMLPLGYVIMQHRIKEQLPVKSYLKWANRIPGVFHGAVLNIDDNTNTIEDDRYCLALLKHYHSLMPMAMEARKPMFLLKPADGAIGAHVNAVAAAYSDFQLLTKKVISLAV